MVSYLPTSQVLKNGTIAGSKLISRGTFMILLVFGLLHIRVLQISTHKTISRKTSRVPNFDNIRAVLLLVWLMDSFMTL